MGLTVSNVILHSSSKVDFQFSRLNSAFRTRRGYTPGYYIRQRAIDTGIRESAAGKTGQCLLPGDADRIFAHLHLPHSPWGYLCALSVARLTVSTCVACVTKTDREITSETVYCDLEFTRCIAVGKETKCDAQVDDALTKNEWSHASCLELYEPGVATS